MDKITEQQKKILISIASTKGLVDSLEEIFMQDIAASKIWVSDELNSGASPEEQYHRISAKSEGIDMVIQLFDKVRKMKPKNTKVSRAVQNHR